LNIFSARLDRSLPRLSLPPDAVQQLQSRKIELAGMELPKNLDANSREAAKHAVSDAFLAGFRVVLFCCVGLAIGGAGTAWVLVPKK